MPARQGTLFQWRLAARSLSRPYPVSLGMVVLLCLVPLYIFIGEGVSARSLHTPELPLDRLIPLEPVWSIIYGALYAFLIALPVFVVREPEHLRRTVLAYLTVWLVAYACFLVYPTAAPRPLQIPGNGFGAWGLRILYDADPPYNCFPSLHVAHSFVSALTTYRVHKRVGMWATVAGSLVAISTVFTKQHYVLDAVGGVVLAFVAYFLFLRRAGDNRTDTLDHELAPTFACLILAVSAGGVVCYWIAYRIASIA